MSYPRVVYTMTSCRRLGHFVRSMRSFLECCQDLDLIDRWILNDDHSDPKDLQFIKKEWPFLEIRRSEIPGQAHALNNLFFRSKIKVEWIFHNEDDWFFMQKGNFIRRAIDVTRSNAKIKNVTLRHWQPVWVQDGHLKYYVHIYDKFLVRTDAEAMEASFNDRMWFGYSLNPGLHHLPTTQYLGQYSELVESRVFDKQHAKRYWQMGYLRANLEDVYITHLGWEASASWQ